MNESIAKQSVELLRRNASMIPPAKLKDTYELIQNEEMQRKYRAGAISKRSSNIQPTLHINEAVADEEDESLPGLADASSDEEDDFPHRLSYMSKGYSGGANKTPKIYPATPKEKFNPCFSFFYGTCEAGDACVYSHDRKVMEKHADESVMRIMNSPYFNKERFSRLLASNGNTKQATLHTSGSPKPLGGSNPKDMVNKKLFQMENGDQGVKPSLTGTDVDNDTTSNG